MTSRKILPVAPIHGVVSTPRTERTTYCCECRMSFVLLNDSPMPEVCMECFEALGRPAATCDECHKPIQPGEPCHLEWARFCKQCCKQIKIDRGQVYKCNTIGRSWDERYGELDY